MRKFSRAFFLIFLMFTYACKSPPALPPPPPEPGPLSRLIFDHIEADSVDHAALFYTLHIENPRSSPVRPVVTGWNAALDGLAVDAPLINCDNLPEISGGKEADILLRLDLDLYALEERRAVSGTRAGDDDNYKADLSLNLEFPYEKENVSSVLENTALFPHIKKPLFTITAIAILQAELINTRFRVSLRIDNPNVFPVDLSSFGYELYGEGRFWAEGEERDVLHIPARGSGETKLFLAMNFIDMKRRLLDEVIAMNLVRYRFTGEVEVGTGVFYLPRFHMDFDHSGNSVVLK
jgi:LEA14-like dessication related protein